MSRMSVVNWSRADVVECLGLKPCSSLSGEKNSLIEGKMSTSRTLAAGHSSEIGLYEVPCVSPCRSWESG